MFENGRSVHFERALIKPSASLKIIVYVHIYNKNIIYIYYPLYYLCTTICNLGYIGTDFGKQMQVHGEWKPYKVLKSQDDQEKYLYKTITQHFRLLQTSSSQVTTDQEAKAATSVGKE